MEWKVLATCAAKVFGGMIGVAIVLSSYAVWITWCSHNIDNAMVYVPLVIAPPLLVLGVVLTLECYTNHTRDPEDDEGDIF
jgi:hypothetical protein